MLSRKFRNAILAGSTLLLTLAAFAEAATITVDTFTDEYGSGGACSLREAVESANDNADFGGCAHIGSYGTDTINLPSGFHSLTRGDFGDFGQIDEDNNALIDIDIRSDLTIEGLTTSTTLSVGNSSGDYRGRVFHIISGNVTINDITIRDGNVPNGRFGGGLRSNPGTTVTLNRVRIVGNEAAGGAGGILNAGTMTLNDCLVDQNKTTAAVDGGGGLYSAAGTLTLNNSRVIDNRTEGNGANGDGAGIYNEADSTLSISNSTIDGNVIAVGGTINGGVSGSGGGIYSRGAFTIRQSTISRNIAAGNQSLGGGIVCDGFSGAVLIERSLIFANESRENPDFGADATGSGGISVFCDGFVMRDSIVSNNTTETGDGGGIGIAGAARIENSTIVGNHAPGDGGGLGASASSPKAVRIVNTTIINNTSDGRGGGTYFSGSGFLAMHSVTITGNSSNVGGGSAGSGGGSAFAVGASGLAMNSVIAGNLASGNAIHDDCSGEIASQGFNLIQSVSGCTVSGGGSTDLFNVSAGLAGATNNGGLLVGASNGTVSGMLTRAPLPNSVLVDGGKAQGCVDFAGTPLVTDQVGRHRSIDGDTDGIERCDIGAIAFLFALFVDSFE